MNERATKNNILEGFEKLRKKLEGQSEKEEADNKESLVVIFVSGNGGERTEKGQKGSFHYFCTSDFDESNYKETSIFLYELQILVSRFNCKHIFFIFDCCFSGAIFSDFCISGFSFPLLITLNPFFLNTFSSAMWTKEGRNRSNTSEMRWCLLYGPFLQRRRVQQTRNASSRSTEASSARH